MKTYSTTVEGMTCGNCALTISRLLEKKGATNVSANAASGEVNFTTGENVDVTNLFDSIDGLGYHVVREQENGDTTDSYSKRDTSTLLIINIVFTALLLLPMFVPIHWLDLPTVQWILATPVLAIGWYVFGGNAIRSVWHRMPNMNVLILLGASVTYCYSVIGCVWHPQVADEFMYFETVASIITLVMAGNWLEHRTVKATTVAIDELLKLQPQTARIIMTDSLGKETVMDIESKYVRPGDVVLINHGDSVPVDGEVIYGNAQVDEQMISGESMPVSKSIGDNVIGGTLLADGNIKVRATTVGASSVLANIVRMVREAQSAKVPLQRLADKISSIFVPAVLLASMLAFFINFILLDVFFHQALMYSIAMIVIACPCAMGLATPAAIAVGLGRAARHGILIKGADTLSQLKKVQQIVFDKTGTLTTGKLEIESFRTNEMEEADFKDMVTSLESHSSHPIAKSILAQWGKGNVPLTNVTEIRGKGMTATDAQGNTWRLGAGHWLHHNASRDVDYDIYLYENDAFRGAIRISDALRPDAQKTITALQSMGYKTILLSGDKRQKCEHIALQLGINEMYAEQSPEQKNEKLDELMRTAPTAMVGDGINDAPSLAKATVGISLSEASQVAIQSANIILSNNNLSALPAAIKLGIYTEQTIRQNLFWALIYNVIAIPFAAAGLVHPIWATAIMGLSDILLIFNSLRLRVRKIA